MLANVHHLFYPNFPSELYHVSNLCVFINHSALIFQAMEADLDEYDKKLECLHRLSHDLKSVCDEKASQDMINNVALLGSELLSIRGRCQEIQDELANKISHHQVAEQSVPVLGVEGATSIAKR